MEHLECFLEMNADWTRPCGLDLTMRIGLEHAVLVSAYRNMSGPLSPVSLCFRSLLEQEKDAKLIATPILHEEILRKSQIYITQGELFVFYLTVV